MWVFFQLIKTSAQQKSLFADSNEEYFFPDQNTNSRVSASLNGLNNFNPVAVCNLMAVPVRAGDYFVVYGDSNSVPVFNTFSFANELTDGYSGLYSL